MANAVLQCEVARGREGSPPTGRRESSGVASDGGVKVGGVFVENFVSTQVVATIWLLVFFVVAIPDMFGSVQSEPNCCF